MITFQFLFRLDKMVFVLLYSCYQKIVLGKKNKLRMRSSHHDLNQFMKTVFLFVEELLKDEYKLKNSLKYLQIISNSLFSLFLLYKSFFCEVFEWPSIQNAVIH
jgi:hypothetical protein